MRELRAVMRARLDERGTTLVETAITLLILGIVMAVFMSFVVSLQTASGRQEGRAIRNDEVRLAMAQLDREIRSGNVLQDPAKESNVGGDVVPNMGLRIYTQADAPNRDPGNQCSQWRITGGTIQTRRWAPSNPQATATKWWTVARGIVNRTVVPAVPAFTVDTDSVSYGHRMVKIRLVVDRADDAAAPEEMDMSITGRNTERLVAGDTGYQDDICSAAHEPSY